MKAQQTITPVAVSELLSRVAGMRDSGFRIVQIGCAKIGDTYEITYSFDRDLEFANLRITVTRETEVPSISGIYWGAFIYENEMHDLFGITVTGMNIDFKGTLIRTTVRYPFSQKDILKGEDPCQNR